MAAEERTKEKGEQHGTGRMIRRRVGGELESRTSDEKEEDPRWK